MRIKYWLKRMGKCHKCRSYIFILVISLEGKRAFCYQLLWKNGKGLCSFPFILLFIFHGVTRCACLTAFFFLTNTLHIRYTTYLIDQFFPSCFCSIGLNYMPAFGIFIFNLYTRILYWHWHWYQWQTNFVSVFFPMCVRCECAALWEFRQQILQMFTCIEQPDYGYSKEFF